LAPHLAALIAFQFQKAGKACFRLATRYALRAISVLGLSGKS
jgi:hypothetical protein